MLQVIAGPRSRSTPRRRTWTVPPYAERLAGRVRDLRLGVVREFFEDGVDPEVAARGAGGDRTLEGLGATRVEVSLPHASVRAPDVLHRRARGGQQQPRPIRRRAVRAPHRARGRPRDPVRADAPRGVRRGGQAAHHARHLRAFRGLLRRVLRAGAAGADAGPARVRGRAPGRGRARRAGGPDAGVPARRARRGSAADVPGGCVHGPPEPRRACPGCRCRAGSPAACRWGCRSRAARSTRPRCSTWRTRSSGRPSFTRAVRRLRRRRRRSAA